MSLLRKKSLNTIGLFNEAFPPIMDGVSMTVKNYAYWLHQKNQPVCVITPKAPNYVDNELFPVYRYSSIPLLMRKPYRMGIPELDLSIQSTLEKIPFSLVHAHSPFSAGKLALGYAKRNKIPFIATFHSKYREDFEQSVRNIRVAKLMVKDIIRFYEKADEVWLPQASVEETIREYGFRGKVVVVENGNDFAGNEPVNPLKIAGRKHLLIPDNELMFLFVGQHIWEKNIRLIVDALALVKDLPFRMFFIGTGYAAEDLRKMVEEHGLNDKIEFVGVIRDRDKLKQFYAAADLFLFPSVYDNAPLVVREAGAMETPAILVKGSTAAEIISDNQNGFLIENSVEALAAKIRELVSKPEMIKFAGENAAHTIARSWEDVTTEVLDRYQSLILRKWKK